MNDETYRGPAVLTFGDAQHPVQIRLSARFEPVEGRFRWAGRTAPDPELLERVGRTARLRIARTTDVRLSEPDPTGGVRLSGSGTPPWFR